MKNLLNLFLVICFGALIFSCAKDDKSQEALNPNDSEMVENRDNDVCLCHNNNKNNPKIICVDENAVAAHLAHGDVLLIDDDDDGYVVEENNCGVPSGDCDDNDASINPGAEEVQCDGIDNDCNADTEDNPDNDGDGVGVCDDCDDNDANNYPGNEEVCGDDQDNNCDGVVDEDCGPCPGNEIECCFCTWIDNYGPEDVISVNENPTGLGVTFSDGSYAQVSIFGCDSPEYFCGSCSPTVESQCFCGAEDQDGNPVEGDISEEQYEFCRQALLDFINPSLSSNQPPADLKSTYFETEINLSKDH